MIKCINKIFRALLLSTSTTTKFMFMNLLIPHNKPQGEWYYTNMV